MAEYTWRQWENEQNDANLLHASDCERWQAGIELAGGTWDGEWTDLDKTGKGLITIDQFNALESQIQSKASSYTPKNYDPDSTVQIVPGPDGWNKVEDGILRSICTPDGVNRNFCLNTIKMDVTPRRNGSATYSGSWQSAIEDSTSPSGYCGGFESYGGASSNTYGYFFPWESAIWGSMVNTIEIGDTFTVSLWAKTDGDEVSLRRTNFINYNTILSYPEDLTLTSEWKRLVCVVQRTSDDDTGIALCLYAEPHDTDVMLYFAGLKCEKADNATDWVPAPEDYGYPGNGTTLTAHPQSVEDGDEVAAPEAEEIE